VDNCTALHQSLTAQSGIHKPRESLDDLLGAVHSAPSGAAASAVIAAGCMGGCRARPFDFAFPALIRYVSAVLKGIR
jgi:hypothetical protein